MWVHPLNYRRRQGGVALVTVILLVALLTVIVSRLSLLNSIWLRQVENSSAMVQASQATRAAQVWVGNILEEDGNDFDGRTDDWAQPMIPIPIAWGEMYGWIEDMQSRFNLNNLVNDEGGVNTQVLQKFEYLLQLLELDPAIAEAIVDWIDPDSNASGRQGAEDIYYLGLSQPYMAANRPLLDEEELRLVRGIDQAAWNRLQPYICVLPEQTSININTAGPEVIAAALYNPDSPANLVTEIGNWVQDVQINPLSSLEEVKQQAAERLNISDVEGLDVRTGYFRAHTQMAFGNVEHRMSTLYRRAGGRATILQHSRTLF